MKTYQRIKLLSSLKKKDISGKTALVRVDLNLESLGDTFRVDAILPTILFLRKHKVKVVLLSHRGRPKPLRGISKAKFLISKQKEFSLKPFAGILSKELKQRVIFIPNFDFWEIKREIENSNESIFLLENLRFWEGEEKNDAKFAKQLASLGDFYVNDAFAVCHRKNASVVAITRFLPSYAGLLLEEEIENLDKLLKSYSHRPFTIIIGGAKVSDKIGVIKNFWDKADFFLLGGGPANTFFAAQGLPVGDSLVDRSMLGSPTRGLTSQILRGRTSQILRAIRVGSHVRSPTSKILLPIDVKIRGKKILDIGEQTVGEYGKIIKKSKTIIWNGPMGLFEKKDFEKGTAGIWKAVLTNRKAQIIVGGGETVASLQLITNNQKLITNNQKLFISTGGGAMLAYLAGEKLPGIDALKR